MITSRRCRTRLGFTLIELIVVISIIALLMAVLLPSVSKTRAKSAAVVCGTRIKGLTTALATYLADWNDTMPINGVIMPKTGIPIMYDPNKTADCDPRYAPMVAPKPDQWRLEFGALWPYMGGPPLPIGVGKDTVSANPLPLIDQRLPIARAYLCPTDAPVLERTFQGTGTDATRPLWIDTSSGVPRVQQGVGAPGYWSYSVNSVLNSLGRFRDRFNVGFLPWSDPLRMYNVKSPHDFVTFIEEDNASLFNDEVVDAPAYSQGDMLTRRHGGSGNVGFGDGHVELFNEIIFDHPPSAISGTYVQHTEAMTSEVTRKFFPDRGAFANP